MPKNEWDNLFEEAEKMRERERSAQEEMDKLVNKMIEKVENDDINSIEKEDIVIAIIGLHGLLKTNEIHNLF